MNEAHKIGIKKNRLARLTRKLKEKNPSTVLEKQDRKNALTLELTQAGVKL